MMLTKLIPLFLSLSLACACFEKQNTQPVSPTAPEEYQLAPTEPIAVFTSPRTTVVRLNPAFLPKGVVGVEVTFAGVYYGLFLPQDLIYLVPVTSRQRLDLVFTNGDGEVVGNASYNIP